MSVRRVGHVYKTMWCIHCVMPLSFLMSLGQSVACTGNLGPMMEYLRRKYDIAKSSQGSAEPSRIPA